MPSYIFLVARHLHLPMTGGVTRRSSKSILAQFDFQRPPDSGETRRAEEQEEWRIGGFRPLKKSFFLPSWEKPTNASTSIKSIMFSFFRSSWIKGRTERERERRIKMQWNRKDRKRERERERKRMQIHKEKIWNKQSYKKCHIFYLYWVQVGSKMNNKILTHLGVIICEEEIMIHVVIFV